ncbi:LacI family DNA-binding transcriptional regulator [Pseudarthrobacter phenanthrenivorans]|uniref:LacI family DNA-binding transcriptional regulator n=1 Tax=Pseudarthrobacter phenanthrenivorans TaxID=361575 RepID=UPI002F358081
MPVTRNDVAKAAGVSPGVVSYVLNSGPRPVSADTRQRVLNAVEVLGYKRDGLARSLKTGRTDTLGVILPDASNPFFAELARAIEGHAYSAGKSVLVCNSADDTDRERSYLSTLLEKRVDGIILVSASGEEDLTDVLSRGIPIVAMDRYRAHTGVSTVRFDNRHAGYTATRHLMEHGYTRIALITGPGSVPVSDERLQGYGEALTQDPGHPSYIQGAPFTFAGGYEAIQTLLKHSSLPSGIICSSDVQAVGATAALVEQGLLMPGDVALVSIDGTALTAFTNPSLTTMGQPIAQMARLAIEAVLHGGTATHATLKGQLTIRRSCGCAPHT